MKKYIAIILVIVAFNFYIVGYAANSPTFTVSSPSAKPGDTIKVTVSVSGNPGLTSMKFAVDFDSELTLEKVEYNSSFSGQTLQPSSFESPVTLIWLSPFENVNYNGTFATLTFKVSPNVKSGYEANINLSYNSDDVYNLKEENINFAITNGKVSITTNSVPTVCLHNNKTKINAKDSTCTEKGWDEYYICDDCGQTISSDGASEVASRPFRPLASHKGGTATCKSKAVCSVCGNPYGNTINHSYTSQSEKEAALKKAGTCQTKAEYYYSCSMCGTVEKNDNHVFYGASASHSFTKYVSDGNATTETDGTKTAKCDYCNEIKTIVDIGSIITSDHKHTFGVYYKTNSNEHWKVCACGTVSEKSKHSFNDWIVVKSATATSTGIKKQICNICGYEITEIIPIISYNKNASIKVASSKVVDYRSNVTIVANASGIDNGYHLEIVIGNASYKGTRTEVKADIGEIRSDVNYEVRVVKDNGEVQNDLTKSGCKVICNSSFIKRLVAFFKGIFGKLPAVTIKP